MCQKSVKFQTAIKRLQNKKKWKKYSSKDKKSKQTIRLQKKETQSDNTFIFKR